MIRSKFKCEEIAVKEQSAEIKFTTSLGWGPSETLQLTTSRAKGLQFDVGTEYVIDIWASNPLN